MKNMLTLFHPLKQCLQNFRGFRLDEIQKLASEKQDHAMQIQKLSFPCRLLYRVPKSLNGF